LIVGILKYNRQSNQIVEKKYHIPKPDVYNNKGVTLVELMVVLVISAILMAVVYTAYLTQHKTGHVQHQVVTMQQDLRASIDIMERDIRMAGCDPTGNTTAGILTWTANSLGVTMDIDESGTIDAGEQVVYSMAQATLFRSGQSLAVNVTSLGFTYFDSDNNPAGSVNDIRSVVLNIVVRSEQIDPDTGQPITRTLTRRVRCRNLGL